MKPSYSSIALRKNLRKRHQSVFSSLCAAWVLAGAVFVLAGCSSSEPFSSDVATIAPEIGRAVVGYNDTEYVYPIQVPNTNRYVQMRTSEPLDFKPTYEDYLKWKGE